MHQHHIRIRLALPNPRFFPASPSILTILTKGFTQALPASNVTPTPTPYSNSPPRFTYPRIFSRLSTSIYASKAVEPNHQRHPYANMVRHIQG